MKLTEKNVVEWTIVLGINAIVFSILGSGIVFGLLIGHQKWNR
jgi:hypothetical protein